jgi:tRNA pseudouridine55 synthase
LDIFGILNVTKPPGWTSFDVVALVRRLTKTRRVGHGGTLDPLATGVLPVLLGQATRLAEYLIQLSKGYRAEVRLGVATDTYDAEGDVTFQGNPANLTFTDIQSAVASFIGQIEQTAPRYSAIKHKGKPLYSYARAGVALPELKKREVTVYSLDIVDLRPPTLTLDIECGSGTYIRSLAHDLGLKLGCGAHLSSLTRTHVGPLSLKNSTTIEQLRSAPANDWQANLLIAPDALLTGWRAAILDEPSQEKLRLGQSLDLNTLPREEGELCRAYSTSGRFIAILNYSGQDGIWQPKKMFSLAT